jgi:serine/threonine-protein kinase
LTEECTAQESTDSLLETGGTILYSSVEQNVYRIFRMLVDENMVSTLLVNNGAQPQLSPDGRMLAFYNRQPGQDGLWGYAMGLGLSPDDRSIHYSSNPEDSRDAPPSWDWSSSRLTYGSTRSADPTVAHHVYITRADTDPASDARGFGKDPAWQPDADWIVYNGPEDSGQGPTGLWLMRADGSQDVRLTSIGNDLRPTWSPDGRYIVFMSKDRLSTNWDLYRLDLQTESLMQLTTDPGQDGLPTISPDGKWVAFMSDRGQVWRLWYVSIDGGEEQLLSTISGQPIQWLEHAIQWVP